MKKLLMIVFLLSIFSGVHAQLTNTKWKGVLKIQDDIPTIFDFGKDTLTLTTYANNVLIEDMTYTIADSVLTLKKISGQSDCDQEIGKYKYSIKGELLLLNLVSDGCEDRSSVLDNISLTKFQWPAVVNVDEGILKQYPGVYAMDAQHKITITFENGKLMADSPTNLVAKTQLYPASNTKFDFHYADINLEFVNGTDGKPVKLVVHQDGKDYDWKKE